MLLVLHQLRRRGIYFLSVSIFASLPKLKGYLDSMPVALLSLLLGIRAEKKIGPRSHLAAAQKRAGPGRTTVLWLFLLFFFYSSRSQTNSDMLVLLELLLAKSLGITSDCSLRQITSCKCCAASGPRRAARISSLPTFYPV